MSKVSKVSIQDRLLSGNFAPGEAMQLAHVGRPAFYRAVKDGKLGILKRGHSSLVPGPILARFLKGQPIDDLVGEYPGLITGDKLLPTVPNSEKGRRILKANEDARRTAKKAEEAPPCP